MVMILGVLIGLPAVRVRGVQLGMLTLAAAFATDALYFGNLALNGGSSVAAVTGPRLFGVNLGIGSGASYPRAVFGLFVLVSLVLACLVVVALRRSRLGHDMLAVRANERAAAAAGINVARTKLIAFAIGAALAGLGGALMAYQSGQVSSDSFTTLTGIMFFVIAYLASPTSVSGALVAGLIGPVGLVATFVSQEINLGTYYALVTAFLLVFAAVRHPEGIAGSLQSVFENRRARAMQQPLQPAPHRVPATVAPAPEAVKVQP
jgi:ABC-type branched-subunit amino acid transport system permease subunit